MKQPGLPNDHHWGPQDGGRFRKEFLAKCGLDIDKYTTTLWAANKKQTAAHNVLHAQNYNAVVLNFMKNEKDCCIILIILLEIIDISLDALQKGVNAGKIDNGGLPVPQAMEYAAIHPWGDPTVDTGDELREAAKRACCPPGRGRAKRLRAARAEVFNKYAPAQRFSPEPPVAQVGPSPHFSPAEIESMRRQAEWNYEENIRKKWDEYYRLPTPDRRPGGPIRPPTIIPLPRFRPVPIPLAPAA
jgi:hypothetical protein